MIVQQINLFMMHFDKCKPDARLGHSRIRQFFHVLLNKCEQVTTLHARKGVEKLNSEDFENFLGY